MQQRQQQQQQGSQYGVSPDLVSIGSTPPRTQMLAAGEGGSEQAEAASPISSRPPASIVNFDDLVDDTDRAGSSGISSGNRWPRQETVTLLKIRSEMDVAFRDAALKGPLWEEVSRKLGELGYIRSAKKCKEKFENVHKYYKRTKEGKAGRQDGKSYRFFTQLEALQGVTASGSGSGVATNVIPSSTTTTPPPVMTSSGPPTTPASSVGNIQFPTPASVGIGGGTTSGVVMQRGGVAPPSQPFTMYSSVLSVGVAVPAGSGAKTSVSVGAPAPAVAPVEISFSSDSSSSGSFDEDEEEVDDMLEEERPSSNPVGSGHKRKRGRYSSSSKGGSHKRRMMDFFEGLMKQVMQKQEAMQQRLLETIENREQERMLREDAWKRQDAARVCREQELMVQERAIAALRDAAIVSFLQQITGQTIQLPQPVSTIVHHVAVTPAPPPPPSVPTMPHVAPASTPSSTPPPSRQQFQQKPHKLQPRQVQQQHQQPNTDLVRQHQMRAPPSTEVIMAIPERQIPTQDPPSGGGGSSSEAASSRWPKVEILALIKLRSNLENRYQEAGPKGPLWEEISAGMQQMGYSRSSKRCKEKWENINKYFKKVKESNKKRPEDAKTCPYFNELDALYQKKILGGANSGSSSRSMVPFQQQQPQQGLAVDQSKHQETSTSNLGAVRTSAAQVESINKRDGTDLVLPDDGGLPDNIFEDQGGNAGATRGSRKPEDIIMELMEQQQGQQLLNLDDEKMDELGDSRDNNNVEEDQGEDEDEWEEDRKVAYKKELERPSRDNKNGGNNGAPSFITTVQ